MADNTTATPSFADGTQGLLLFQAAAGPPPSGVVGSLFEWRYFSPENKKSMNNYKVTPQSIVNANNPYCSVKGGWDLAAGNFPHSTSYNINLNNLLILFLGLIGGNTPAGYLGTFKVTGFEAGHSKQAGGDYAFTADQQGAITLLPSSG